MKNLKNYLIAGMIGAGSLAGFNGYGQDVSAINNITQEIPALTVKAQFVNHQEFQIESWREFGDGEIVLNKYFDKNHDGKTDSFFVYSYSPENNKVSKENLVDTLGLIEGLFPNYVKKNLPLGKTFIDCKEGYFKENIYDYIKPK